MTKALGVERLEIGSEIAPGVPWCFAESEGQPIAVTLKSGNFGAKASSPTRWRRSGHERRGQPARADLHTREVDVRPRADRAGRPGTSRRAPPTAACWSRRRARASAASTRAGSAASTPRDRQTGGDPPTKEMPLHSAFYDTRASAGAVVHLHSCHAVALSTMPDADEDDFLPRLTPYAIMSSAGCSCCRSSCPGDPAIGAAVRGLAGRRKRGDARQPWSRGRRQGRRGRLQRHRGAGGHRPASDADPRDARECSTPVPVPPPTSRHNPFSAQAFSRFLSLFSRVVAQGLLTSGPAQKRNPFSPGRYSLDLLPLGDLVGCLKLLSLGDFPEGLSLGVRQNLWVAQEFEIQLPSDWKTQGTFRLGTPRGWHRGRARLVSGSVPTRESSWQSKTGASPRP